MRCTHWVKGKIRCEEKATRWIIDETGLRIPGGFECQAHAEMVVKDVNEKTELRWTLEEIDGVGSRILRSADTALSGVPIGGPPPAEVPKEESK